MMMLHHQLCSLVLLTVFGKIMGSALYGPCESDGQCGTLDTYCKNGTCSCEEHFISIYDSCVPSVTPENRCKKTKDCHAILGGRSSCKEGRCACKPFHHLHNGICVKNRDLFDRCENDSQCYCGKGCVHKIACINNFCACKPGYKTYSSRCIHDPATKHLFAKQETSHNESQTPTLGGASSTSSKLYIPIRDMYKLYLLMYFYKCLPYFFTF